LSQAFVKDAVSREMAGQRLYAFPAEILREKADGGTTKSLNLKADAPLAAGLKRTTAKPNATHALINMSYTAIVFTMIECLEGYAELVGCREEAAHRLKFAHRV
jgi:hypothetical protein